MKGVKLMERDFMGFIIRQRTDNYMFCLTDLMNSYEKLRQQNGWPEKRIDDFFRNDDNISYICEIIRISGGSVKPDISGFMEHVEREGV